MKIFIYTNFEKEITAKTKNKLISISKKLDFEITDEISDCDMIISIGGDGTFLESSHKSYEKPLIGINTGTLGYLTEINPEDIENALESILDGKYYIERRMMVEGEIVKPSGDVIEIPPALNEIAISKNAFGVVRFNVLVNEKVIYSYTADGILVCTPTGSTAYNLSCGGPIVDPTAHIITLTPIAPHTVINRSIVLADDSTVEIEITELRENTSSYVLYDSHPIEIFSGDIVRIRKSDRITKIIKIENTSFIDTIRENIS